MYDYRALTTISYNMHSSSSTETPHLVLGTEHMNVQCMKVFRSLPSQVLKLAIPGFQKRHLVGKPRIILGHEIGTPHVGD